MANNLTQSQAVRTAPLKPKRVKSSLWERLRQKPGLALAQLFLIVWCLFLLMPFVWLFSSSLKDKAQYFVVPNKWLPDPALWSNYVDVFTEYNFGRYMLNSSWLALVTVGLSCLSSSLVAYGFARFHFKGRNVLFVLVLATMMLPPQILTISLYGVYKNLGWLNSFLPIIVPYLFGNAFNIFLFRQFFISLPRELDEAAYLDGCGSFGIYRRIIMPQSKPVLILVALSTFIGSWKDVWGPLIYLNSDENRTLPIGLLYFSGPFTQDYPKLLSATIVALIIPVVFYLLGQRYINSGVVIAEVK